MPSEEDLMPKIDGGKIGVAFDMRETNDWFCRRKGAFDDALTASAT